MANRDIETGAAQAGRMLGDAVMDALETVALKLAGRIRAVQEDQAETREQLHALMQRVEALERPYSTRRERNV